jgi:hypothetical protein
VGAGILGIVRHDVDGEFKITTDLVLRGTAQIRDKFHDVNGTPSEALVLFFPFVAGDGSAKRLLERFQKGPKGVFLQLGPNEARALWELLDGLLSSGLVKDADKVQAIRNRLGAVLPREAV